MAPQFGILEKVSEEARRAVANIAFAQRDDDCRSYVCKRGDCVWGALLRAEGEEEATGVLAAWEVAPLLGVPVYTDWRRGEFSPEYKEICQIIDLNDGGKLRTRAAVRTLLGIADTPPPPAPRTGAAGGEA